MAAIDIEEIVKGELDVIMEELGCKTYNEAVNILVRFYKPIALVEKLEKLIRQLQK